MTATPRTLTEVSALAADVYDKMIRRYNQDDQNFVDDENDKEGLILPCAGSVALLLLANNFEEIGKDARWHEIVRREFDRVQKHVEERGYDATPFVPERITEKLFSKAGGYYYTDSLSWVLSLTTQIRVATFRKNLFEADSTFMMSVLSLMKDALSKICDAACPQGGWNFSNECTAPHLYYSFAVTEALADFGDYILGETPQIFGKNSKESAEDVEVIKLLTSPLVERVNEKRRMTLEYLKETYLSKLGDAEIEPVENPGVGVSSQHLKLYYTYFVIEMLVTCNLPEFHREWSEDIDDATEMGIYLSRIDLEKARKDKNLLSGGKTWWDDAAESTLKINDWSLFKNASLIPDRDKLSKLGEPGLIPLAVRCNAQYAYYVAKGRDAKMGKLFALLLEDRHEEQGLWDAKFYNLLITERAVEAIVDYYDYLSEYERETAVGNELILAQESKLDLAFRELLREEVRAYLGTSASQLEANAIGESASDGSTLTEEVLVRKLTSTLATANAYARGSDGADLPVNKKDIDRLQENFTAFISNLFYATLADVHPEEPDKLRTGVSANVQDLWVSLAPWIAASQKLKLGNLFSHLANETLKNVETGKPPAKARVN